MLCAQREQEEKEIKERKQIDEKEKAKEESLGKSKKRMR